MKFCRRDFVIFEANKGPQTQICNGYGDTIYLFHTPDTKHFDVIYTKDFINVSSFCQCKYFLFSVNIIISYRGGTYFWNRFHI